MTPLEYAHWLTLPILHRPTVLQVGMDAIRRLPKTKWPATKGLAA